MTDAEQRAGATKFHNEWRDKGDEKSDCQRFWIEFCSKVLGITDVTQKLVFEKRVIIDGQTKFIDVYIPETRVLIEQKSYDKPLNKKYLQSDGSQCTPFEQGRNYAHWMIPDEAPLWVIACNFQSFEIHDMNKPQEEPVVVFLDELPHKFSLFSFMFKKEVKELSHEMEISIKAGEIVGILYDKLIAQYKEPDEESLKSLNALCVRLVFCLYAEDAGIFGTKLMFHDYLRDIPVTGMRKALVELFKILDTKEEDRDKYLAEDNPKLAAFPYVNGGLFADENIEIPPFTEEIKELLLNKASADFDWSDISPTIFGAVFESTLNPETRRSGGMHYTSIENIHKVIDPLFMEELQEEYETIHAESVLKTKVSKLQAFQTKISELRYLDPACGSGNFLTETYISLRRLENAVIRDLIDSKKGQVEGQIAFGDANVINPIHVSISQFYGIEINDFAVTVAKTALWIAESQMLKETEDVVQMNLEFLPLKSYANIYEGNALTTDWNEVVSKNELSYIMGNPPFVGTKLMSKEQKKDTDAVLGKIKNAGVLDYVACWYKKACDYIQNTRIQCALVSTNSIVQGEQVRVLWGYMFDNGIQINFAYKTFQWDSEANDKAHVHCVIIGFSILPLQKDKKIYEGKNAIIATNINGYLVDAPNVLIDNRKTPICQVEEMSNGCKFLDDGNYIFTEDEKDIFVNQDKNAIPFIRAYYGARNFINREKMYCIWLKDANPSEVRKSEKIIDRIAKVQAFRKACSSADTQKYADRPMLPTRLAYYSNDKHTDALLVPIVSSQNRRYLPIGYVDKESIISYSCMLVPNASMYTFGVLMSNVHMAWVRVVCGRMKSDFRYSNTIVYNNFPWPTPTDEQKKAIEKTAQGILDARALYPDSSLADLYDELTMPIELRKAHLNNDRAVMQAYGFSVKDMTEESCVAELMKMYQTLTEKATNC